jgi:hypothetical protein
MEKQKLIIKIILILTTCSTFGNAGERSDTDRPRTHIQMQYAGNMGLVSIGLGSSLFSEKLTACFIYGYLPGNINDVTVHTLALKTTYSYINISINKKSNINGYFGASLIRGFTRNTFAQLPDYYPEGYYSANAFHVALFTGAKHTKLIEKNNLFEKISLFAEVGTLDYIIWYGIKTRYIDIFDIWNISFGVLFTISKKK